MKQTTFSISGETRHRIAEAVRRICQKAGELPPDHHVVVRAYVRSDNHRKKRTKKNPEQGFRHLSQKTQKLLEDFNASLKEGSIWGLVEKE